MADVGHGIFYKSDALSGNRECDAHQLLLYRYLNEHSTGSFGCGSALGLQTPPAPDSYPVIPLAAKEKFNI